MNEYGLIANTRLLVNELERFTRQLQYEDFFTEYITVETEDGEQYLIDNICLRYTNSDPSMRHVCLKLVKPTTFGGGIIQ